MKLFEIPMVVTSLVGLGFLAGLDAPPARADFTFGQAVNLGPTVNSPANEISPVVSSDGLELYFASNRPGGDIWMAKRANAGDPWGPPVNLAQLRSGSPADYIDYVTSISADGLTLYIHSSASYDWGDVYAATRPARDAPWARPAKMGPGFNRAKADSAAPVISPDDLELFFASAPGDVGGVDIYVSTRATPAHPWDRPVNLGPTVNTPQHEIPQAISPDGLVLFIAAYNHPGGLGDFDMQMARRPYKGAAWSVPVNLGPSFNTAGDDRFSSVSGDGRWVYFDNLYSERPGGQGAADLWQAPILPIVDFNADSKVDAADLLALVLSLGTNQTLYDIGPYAWGDGKVDIEDLKVFVAEWEKANPPAQP